MLQYGQGVARAAFLLGSATSATLAPGTVNEGVYRKISSCGGIALSGKVEHQSVVRTLIKGGP
jgi:hypothetical protein